MKFIKPTVRHRLFYCGLVGLWALASTGCGAQGHPVDAPSDAQSADAQSDAQPVDAQVDAQPDTRVDVCGPWCARMRECELMGASQERCVQACEAAVEPSFATQCTACLNAATCDEAWGGCFAQDAACHRAPVTSYMATIGGFAHALEGRVGAGRLITYSGESLGAFDDAEVRQNQLQLSFGTVLSPGLEYRVQYWIDRDADGVCVGGSDDSYEYGARKGH